MSESYNSDTGGFEGGSKKTYEFPAWGVVCLCAASESEIAGDENEKPTGTLGIEKRKRAKKAQS